MKHEIDAAIHRASSQPNSPAAPAPTQSPEAPRDDFRAAAPGSHSVSPRAGLQALGPVPPAPATTAPPKADAAIVTRPDDDAALSRRPSGDAAAASERPAANSAPAPVATPSGAEPTAFAHRLGMGTMACLRGVQRGLRHAGEALQRGFAAVRESLWLAYCWARGTDADGDKFYPCSEELFADDLAADADADTAPAQAPLVAVDDSRATAALQERTTTPAPRAPVASVEDVRSSVQVTGIKPIHFADTVVIDAPLFDIAAVILDRDAADWVPNHTSSRVLQSAPDGSVRGYMSLESHGKKTDVVTDTRLLALPEACLDQAPRGILCSIVSVPPTSQPNQPPAAGHQRVAALRGRFVLRELSPNRTRVDYAVGVDVAMRWLPSFIITRISGNQAGKTLQNLAERVAQPEATRLKPRVRAMFPQFT